MRGKVEVYAIHSDGSETLLLEEPNLVVDGAGESIVDMLTTPSCTLGISPKVMDTSNWRWGAISFGPAAASFSANAYFFPSGGIYYNEDDLCDGVSADVNSYINQISTDRIIRPRWLSGTVTDPTPSTYTPPYQLPSYPDPLNKKLEDASTAYSIVSGDGTVSYGHFENRPNFASGDASSYFQGTYALSGQTLTTHHQTSGILVSSYEGDWQADPYLHMTQPSPNFESQAALGLGGTAPVNVFSYYNYYSQMDLRGFIETTYGPDWVSPNNIGMVAVSGAVAGVNAVDLVIDPRVTINTTIWGGDLWAMNLYGGLHQIGLWSVNCKESLKNQEPPFTMGPTLTRHNLTTGVSPIEYRLFAKKTFTENLAQVKDDAVTGPGITRPLSGHVMLGGINVLGVSDYLRLRLSWTIDFRAKHG